MTSVKKLTLSSPDYPLALKQIPDPPAIIYALGDLKPLLNSPKLAVVGSRKVSPYGRQVTQQLVREVASRGVVIVSGLALGVDSIAHNSALEVGGYTIAVLGTSLDQLGPASNRHIAKEILKAGGAIISEYPPGSKANRLNFIARNRIVSGLSEAVLITEAAIKSGTLHTANFALEQGKNLMAVPGNINSPMSEGTNNLIKIGAQLVTKSEDILLTLNISDKQKQTVLFSGSEAEAVIIKLINNGVTDAAELLQLSQLDASTFNQAMGMLEINGQIHSLGANHWGT